MPELPEIAVYKKYVDSTSLHKKIMEINFPQTSILQSPASRFIKTLQGSSFLRTQRLGKYLFLETDQGPSVVLHFGMTGTLEYYGNQEPPKYTQMEISFEDGYHLAFTCRRKLGKIYLTESLQAFQEAHSIGKDALDFNMEEFLELLQEHKGSIKALLTDQHLISGIGNVYADEILYQAKVHPNTKLEKLTPKERRDIFTQLGHVINMVIKKDGHRSKLPATFLVPHRKEGDTCPKKCSGKVKKMKISGRSTYFCPSCQKEKT